MAGTGTSASSSPLHTGQVSVGSAQTRALANVQGGFPKVVRTTITVGATTGTGTAGALVDTDEINLMILPPRSVIRLGTSMVKLSATQGASTDIDIGFRAYTNISDAAVAEDPDGIYNGITGSIITLVFLGNAGGGALGALSDTLGFVELNNKTPVTVFMTALDGGGTYDGDVADTLAFSFDFYNM